MKFVYEVWITTDTQAHADQVIAERVGFDEELKDDSGAAFDYTIEQAHVIGQLGRNP